MRRPSPKVGPCRVRSLHQRGLCLSVCCHSGEAGRRDDSNNTWKGGTAPSRLKPAKEEGDACARLREAAASICDMSISHVILLVCCVPREEQLVLVQGKEWKRQLRSSKVWPSESIRIAVFELKVVFFAVLFEQESLAPKDKIGFRRNVVY